MNRHVHLTSIAEPAPAAWKELARPEDSRLHQLAPYIGKLKPVIAGHLIRHFTRPGDVILDCFSGSGTIPLEAILLGRRVLAFDANPYAVTLTRAKLEAPSSLDAANLRLKRRLADAQTRPAYDLSTVPEWVTKFFHPDTLHNSLRFADECIAKDDQFMLACLLSILHHQRPGFLSYPSSHLVPYLRDKKFPRVTFPDLYDERALAPRLEAKIRRAYKHHQARIADADFIVKQESISDLTISTKVDAIITSPPYMNALDYVRDNRLRMWFLDRNTVDYAPEPTDKKEQFDALTEAFARNALSRLQPGGVCILVVGETVRRKRITSHPAERIYAQLKSKDASLDIEQVISDEIPDVRRARRSASGTKRELILVLRKDGCACSTSHA